MDTGSRVQCHPCLRCSNQYSPIYNSTNSSTYTRLPCNSEYCIFSQPLNTSCTSSEPCFYHQQYQGVGSIENLSREQPCCSFGRHPGEARICAFGRWKAWLRVELGAGTVCFVLTGSSN
ncbi:hypothetical protein POUND7_010738, partial [Theobroma cacao]